MNNKYIYVRPNTKIELKKSRLFVNFNNIFFYERDETLTSNRICVTRIPLTPFLYPTLAYISDKH